MSQSRLYREQSSNQKTDDQKCRSNEERGGSRVCEHGGGHDVGRRECCVRILDEVSREGPVGVITPVLIHVICWYRETNSAKPSNHVVPRSI